MKRLVLLTGLALLVLIHVMPLYAKGHNTSTELYRDPDAWTYSVETYDRGSVPPERGTDDLQNISYPLETDEGLCSLWIIGEMDLPSTADSGNWYFSAGQFNGAAEFYVNGVSIGWIGNADGKFFFPKYIQKYTAVPPGLIRAGESNEFALRLVSDSRYMDKAYTPYLFTAEYMPMIEFIAFTNAHMYIAFSLLALFIAFYYLIEFLFDHKKINYLYFFIANTGLVIYFFEMGAMLTVFGMGWDHAVGKAALSLFFLFLTLFIIEHFDIFNWLALKIPIAIVGGGFIVLLLIIEKIYHKIDAMLTFSLMPATLELILMAVITVLAVKRKKPYSTIIMVGISIGILFGLYDIIYTFAGEQSLFWLQGPGILIFNISLFVAHVLGNIATRRELGVTSHIQGEQARDLKRYVEGLRETSGAVADMSSTVNKEVSDLSSITVHIKDETDKLSSVVDLQYDTVQKSERTINHVLKDFSETTRLLDQQIEEFQGASSIIEMLLTNMDQIAGSLNDTVRQANEMETLAIEGEASIQNARSAMGRIKQLSANIDDVVEVMTDLAVSTNMLAMNAAIEAAHAGQAGKGFAVVATEIQNLAEASAVSSGEVRSEMEKISASITEGLEVNEQLQTVLQKVSTAMQSTAVNLRTVLESVDVQQAASKEISKAIVHLNEGSSELQQRVRRQNQEGQDIDNSIKSLVQVSQEVHKEIGYIVEDSGKLSALVREMDEVSSKGRNQVERLRSVLDSSSKNEEEQDGN